MGNLVGTISVVFIVIAMFISGVVPIFNTGKDLGALGNDKMTSTKYVLENADGVTGAQVKTSLTRADVEVEVDFIEKTDIDKDDGDIAKKEEIALIEDSAIFEMETEVDADGQTSKITYTQVDLSRTN